MADLLTSPPTLDKSFGTGQLTIWQRPLVSMAVRTTNLTIQRIEHLATRDE